MTQKETKKIAIVDYGMGNIFSVKHACEKLGAQVLLTTLKKDLLEADGVILPGVGSFGDAMRVLNQLDLVSVLRDIAVMGKPLMGICLGIQLLMTESYEFGCHPGLKIIEGSVIRFDNEKEKRSLKVPHVGWNQIYSPQGCSWSNTPLSGINAGDFVYFVHSFYASLNDPNVVLSISQYGDTQFCSSLLSGNVLGCQFHPEKSGAVGLKILRQFLQGCSNS